MSDFILVSSDLMFISKVREVAIASGRELQTIRSLEKLHELTQKDLGAGTIMVDLERAPIPLDDLKVPMRDLSSRGWRVVSFYSHVHEDLSSRALALGLGEVMPRSRFVRELPSLFTAQAARSGGRD